MKRFLIAALTATMLTSPLASVQAAHLAPATQGNVHLVQVKKPKPEERQRKVVKKPVKQDKKATQKKVKKEQWVRGKRVPQAQRKNVVRDYHKRGLRRPADGQQWVKVNDDYLLIGIATGIISSVIAGK